MLPATQQEAFDDGCTFAAVAIYRVDLTADMRIAHQLDPRRRVFAFTRRATQYELAAVHLTSSDDRLAELQALLDPRKPRDAGPGRVM